MAPFLPGDLVARLDAAGPETGIALAASGERQHYTIALWPTALRDALPARPDREPPQARQHDCRHTSQTIESFHTVHLIAVVDFQPPHGADEDHGLNRRLQAHVAHVTIS